MIPQSTAPVAARWLGAPCESSDHGSRISVASGVVSFFKALHPDYASGSTELPTLCVDSPEKGYHCMLQRTVLAVRMISFYAGLPADVVSYIAKAADFASVARWLDSCRAAPETDKTVNSDDENQSQARKQQRHKTHQPARLPKTAIGLGAASCLGVVGAVPTHNHEGWIAVDYSGVLEMIGHHPAYPLDGRYRQLVDIDASGLSGPIGSETVPFTGEYDGRCYSINKLRHCFVQKLDGHGRIDNVRFARAEIDSSDMAGVVACELSGRAALGNVEVEHSVVSTEGSPAGIGAGVVGKDALINGFSTFNCTTKTQRGSSAGAVAGVAYGTINNTRVDKSWVEAFHADAGGAAGRAAGGAVIDNTVLVSTGLAAFGDSSCAGGGAGVVESGATVANTLLVDSNLQTHSYESGAAGGGGSVHGTVINTTMVDGWVVTSRPSSPAAVGAGRLYSSGQVVNTTGQRVRIATTGISAEAAVGVGRAEGVVKGTVCHKSIITTSNTNSSAGIGVGRLSGRAVDVVAYDCHVQTHATGGDVGFGSGAILPNGDFRNLTVVYGRAQASGNQASKGINGGDSPFICGASVMDEYQSPPCCKEYTKKHCLPVPEDACKLADCRVLTRDCRPVSLSDAAKGYDSVCPALPDSTIAQGACQLARSAALARDCRLVALPDAGKGYDLVCPVLPNPTAQVLASSAAPVAAISTGALAGGIVVGSIALGLVGVAGFVLYQHYHQQHRRDE